ncbi:MAG: FecR domain-containing protein, partial [Parvibaculaceae bacterium]|nr:FecR domain-containing protein [Parvibaculaceae bacterium]
REISRRQLLQGGAIAASVAGIGLINDWPTALMSDHYTGTGEVKSIVLADGSNVTLDADTSMTVDFNRRQRGAQLQQGRAFFHTAQSTERPFVVQAGRGVIRALDARFTVHQWADTITVSAIENATEVVAPNGDKIILGQGQAVSYHPSGLDAVTVADMGSALAWQDSQLVFEDKPLQQVISDLNRYRPGTIYIGNSALLNLRVSGAFDMRKQQDILATISKILPIRAISASKYFVVLV